MPRSLSRTLHGGRHELGQNFLIHRPTLHRMTALVAATSGSILELGCGDGALTRPLARLGRPLTAIDLDERRVRRLREALPHVRVELADATRYPLTTEVVVGNIPFHLTTPILRRLLASGRWRHAVLLTQWEVARKRAGVGGGTMMTAQSAPWFRFRLETRVPSSGFAPRPSVDGGVLSITRRDDALVPIGDRRAYERFVSAVFNARGQTLEAMLADVCGATRVRVRRSLLAADAGGLRLPRDLAPEHWARLWQELGRRW